MERQHNGQKKKDKKTNNDLQNTTQKGKDRAARNPLKTGGELRCSRKVRSFCSTSGIRRVATLLVKCDKTDIIKLDILKRSCNRYI